MWISCWKNAVSSLISTPGSAATWSRAANPTRRFTLRPPRPWGCLRRNAPSSKTPRRGSKQHAGPEPDISWRCHDARPRSAGADRCGQGHRRFPRHHRPRRFAEITRAQRPDRPSAISAAPPPRRPAVVIDGFRATPARQRSGRGGSAASPIARHTDATCRRPYPNAPYTRYPTAIPIKKRRGWLFFAGRAYHTEKIDTFARF